MREERELEWLKKRVTHITASEVAKCFAKGKGVTFGKVAITYIEEKVMQIQENDLVEEVNAFILQFGKDNEPLAIEALRNDAGMNEIVSGTNDSGEILFRTWGNNTGGDSPDYLVLNSEGKEIAVGEIKCPANKVKACRLTREGICTKADLVDEYKYQFATHLIASPHVNELHYTIYNGHVNELSGIPYDRYITHVYYRNEFEGLIKEIKERIPKVHKFIMLCVEGKYQPKDINTWWEENK